MRAGALGCAEWSCDKGACRRISAGLSFSADHRDVISTTYVVLVFRVALENLEEAGKTNLNVFDVT